MDKDENVLVICGEKIAIKLVGSNPEIAESMLVPLWANGDDTILITKQWYRCIDNAEV